MTYDSPTYSQLSIYDSPTADVFVASVPVTHSIRPTRRPASPPPSSSCPSSPTPCRRVLVPGDLLYCSETEESEEEDEDEDEVESSSSGWVEVTRKVKRKGPKNRIPWWQREMQILKPYEVPSTPPGVWAISAFQSAPIFIVAPSRLMPPRQDSASPSLTAVSLDAGDIELSPSSTACATPQATSPKVLCPVALPVASPTEEKVDDAPQTKSRSQPKQKGLGKRSASGGKSKSVIATPASTAEEQSTTAGRRPFFSAALLDIGC
ncbi:hypothetical protein FRB99_006406 [Tulasnella sp. 403]|nr:hypothetical protein FRB99_006406 [Tulasnella sp. 403]